MKNLFLKIQNSLDVIFKALLLAVCATVIIYALPKEGKFKYDFQQGKPWLHENLYAPFDFAVLKSNENLLNEKAEIENNSSLYFNQFDSISRLAINNLRKSLEDSIGSAIILSLEKRNYSLKKVKAIYAAGIVKTIELKNDVHPNQLIVIQRNGHFEEIEFGDLLSIKEAILELQLDSDIINSQSPSNIQNELINAIQHNVFYDANKTGAVKQSKLKNIINTHGKVERSELIVAKGELINEEIYWKLTSLKQEFEHSKGDDSSVYFVTVGKIIFVSLIFFVLVLFLGVFRQNILNVNNRVVFILITFTSVVLMGIAPLYIEDLNIYLLPFCILPIVIKAFYDEIMAAFIYILAMILIGFSVPNAFEFVYIEILAGLIAVFSLVNLKKRSQLLGTAGIIFVTYCIAHLSIMIMQEGTWHNIELNNLYAFGGAATLTLLSYPLIYVFEKIFGFLSDVTLMELSDTNSTLLRNLATKTPGTFQHSMQVANLAEIAIQKIGGNPLLVRTGALYHDIGKLEAPQFFIENQVSGFNPHDDLEPRESARIIINHVIKGVELAKKHNLPEVLIDFIRTHHGTSQVKYFLFKEKEENPNQEIDASNFSYPGPIPFSKETAVLMMADACEAASRSLKTYTAESVNKLIDGIIDGQAKEGQFANADITFKDITTIKSIFKKMLLNIYHVRVEYPKG
ncbi:MAG: putative nucleotidyltransferase with HDIG domain [Salibacteraceae bacterium]|jgi:putative nucleotidyltransferase with HDIG domain